MRAFLLERATKRSVEETLGATVKGIRAELVDGQERILRELDGLRPAECASARPRHARQIRCGIDCRDPIGRARARLLLATAAALVEVLRQWWREWWQLALVALMGVLSLWLVER